MKTPNVIRSPDAVPSVNQNPIRLSSRHPVASGNLRLVYVHPHDPTKLIKIARRDVRERRVSASFHCLRAVHRFYKHVSPRLREIREYRRAERCPPEERRHLQSYFGEVETDLGRGIVVGAVRTAGGELAPTLLQLIREGRLDQALGRRIAEFIDWFLSNRIISGDLHPGNLVYDEVEERMVLVDGIGDKTFIPVRAWSGWLNRRCKVKYVRRFLSGVEKHVRRSAEDLRSTAVGASRSPVGR